MKISELRRFDPAHYIETNEDEVEYLTAALESGDADAIRDAHEVVARASRLRAEPKITHRIDPLSGE